MTCEGCAFWKRLCREAEKDLREAREDLREAEKDRREADRDALMLRAVAVGAVAVVGLILLVGPLVLSWTF